MSKITVLHREGNISYQWNIIDKDAKHQTQTGIKPIDNQSSKLSILVDINYTRILLIKSLSFLLSFLVKNINIQDKLVHKHLFIAQK